MNKPLSIKNAANFLGITQYALRKGARDGTIPCVKVGGKYLFYADQVIELLRAQAMTNIKKRLG